jgi:hypothetical protein
MEHYFQMKSKMFTIDEKGYAKAKDVIEANESDKKKQQNSQPGTKRSNKSTCSVIEID